MFHNLKIEPQYFEAVIDGKKRFEIRNNDRNFEVGDEVILNEWNGYELTGRWASVKIIYLTDYGQPEGQVVFGFRLGAYNPIL